MRSALRLGARRNFAWDYGAPQQPRRDLAGNADHPRSHHIQGTAKYSTSSCFMLRKVDVQGHNSNVDFYGVHKVPNTSNFACIPNQMRIGSYLDEGVSSSNVLALLLQRRRHTEGVTGQEMRRTLADLAAYSQTHVNHQCLQQSLARARYGIRVVEGTSRMSYSSPRSTIIDLFINLILIYAFASQKVCWAHLSRVQYPRLFPSAMKQVNTEKEGKRWVRSGCTRHG